MAQCEIRGSPWELWFQSLFPSFLGFFLPYSIIVCADGKSRGPTGERDAERDWKLSKELCPISSYFRHVLLFWTIVRSVISKYQQEQAHVGISWPPKQLDHLLECRILVHARFHILKIEIVRSVLTKKQAWQLKVKNSTVIDRSREHKNPGTWPRSS